MTTPPFDYDEWLRRSSGWTSPTPTPAGEPKSFNYDEWLKRSSGFSGREEGPAMATAPETNLSTPTPPPTDEELVAMEKERVLRSLYAEPPSARPGVPLESGTAPKSLLYEAPLAGASMFGIPFEYAAENVFGRLGAGKAPIVNVNEAVAAQRGRPTLEQLAGQALVAGPGAVESGVNLARGAAKGIAGLPGRLRRAGALTEGVPAPGLRIAPSRGPGAGPPQAPPAGGGAITSAGGRAIVEGQTVLPETAVTTPEMFAGAEGAIPGLRSGQPELRPTIKPSLTAENIIGLRPIEAGLTTSESLTNVARRLVAKTRIPTPGHFGVENNPFANAALRERSRVQPIIDSVANTVAAQSDNAVKVVFAPDKVGRIPSLAGIVPDLPGAPTIQDVAARLPLYLPHLTPQQAAVMEGLQRSYGPYRQLLDEVGVSLTERQDIMAGGFYLPRGSAALGGLDDPIKVRAGVGIGGGQRGFQKPAIFDSQAQGIEAGYEYSPLAEALSGYSKDASHQATDRHIATFFKTARDPETGVLLGETQKARMLRQNPKIVIEMEKLKDELTRLRTLKSNLTERQNSVIDRMFYDNAFDDIDELAHALDLRVKSGLSKGFRQDDLDQTVDLIRQHIHDLRPDYKLAMRRAAVTPRTQGVIDLPGLQGTTFPDVIANAANKQLRDQQRVATGGAAVLLRTADALNGLYRGVTATLDNTAIGIQGLLGLAGDQRAYLSALKVNVRAWADPQVLGSHINQFDETARAVGAISAREWAKHGLHVGGIESEFQLGRGATAALGRLRPVKAANRAFGYFGDALRLEWADDMLAGELRKGRDLAELAASGDLERISGVVNNMTGWARGRTFRSVGDVMLYAPRFLQSRLETVAKATMGLRPGASIEQRYARNSLLKLIGGGTLLTIAANEALGHDTDFRPIVNGKKNGNFMRVRFGGQDWSFFGTWDSLTAAILTTASGHPEQALRGLSSGIISHSWDVISGEDYVGQPVRDNPVQFAKWLISTNLPFAAGKVPFAAQQAARGEIGSAAATVAGEFSGVKATPLSFGDVRDDLSQQLFQQPYADQEPFVREWLTRQTKNTPTGQQSTPSKEVARLDDIERRYLAAVIDLAEDATRTGRRGHFATWLTYRSIADTARGERRQLRVGQDLEPIDPHKYPEGSGQRAFAELNALYRDPKVVKTEGGPVNWKMFDELRTRLETTWSVQQQNYVLRNEHRQPVPRQVLAALPKAQANSIRDSQDAREQYLRENGHPELAQLSNKAFYEPTLPRGY